MINAVREKVKQFLTEALELKNVEEAIRIVSLTRSDDGWLAEAEVIEKDRALPGHRVFEKKFYTVQVASDLEISSYKQTGER